MKALDRAGSLRRGVRRRKPDAEAAFAAIDRSRALDEGLEDARQEVGIDADAVAFDDDANAVRAR